MEFGRLTSDDIPLVAPLLFRSVQGTGAAFASEEAAQKVLVDSVLQGRRAPYTALVAKTASGIQGVAVAGPSVDTDATEDAELRMLAAFPDGSGRRLGVSLIYELENELRTRGQRALWASGRPEAVQLLLQSGAVVIRDEDSRGGARRTVRLFVRPWPDELETERLRLRAWRPQDLPAFAELNADPRVHEFLLGPLDRAQSDGLAETLQRDLARAGFGFWALELKTEPIPTFIGFAGVRPTEGFPFSPTPELGFRLAPNHWGQGLATEAACAARDHAFKLGFTEIVAFTTPGNGRSRRVLEQVGMQLDARGDFDHPRITPGHPFSRHLLYRSRQR